MMVNLKIGRIKQEQIIHITIMQINTYINTYLLKIQYSSKMLDQEYSNK